MVKMWNRLQRLKILYSFKRVNEDTGSEGRYPHILYIKIYPWIRDYVSLRTDGMEKRKKESHKIVYGLALFGSFFHPDSRESGL